MSLLKEHVLDQALGHHVLLYDLAVLVRGLTDDYTLRLGLEQDTALGDGGGRAVLYLSNTYGGEADLEDADTVEADLLTQFEEVLHSAAQFVERCLDVALLDGALLLDEVSNLLGGDELLVIDRCGEELAVSQRLAVVVL